MNLPSELRRKIEEIKHDFSNGSSVIAKNVLDILTDAINYFDDSNKTDILVLANELLLAKPHMAAPTNILNLFINGSPKLSTKIELLNSINILAEEIRIASETCVNLAIGKLFKKEKTSLLTCSYSSTVHKIIENAGNDLSVYILKTIWNGIDFSVIWQNKLNDLSVKCYVLSEGETLPYIDFALIGADAVLYSGDIINGIPSLSLTRTVNKSGIPLYVVAESFKKCKEIPVADGFELIPKEFITEFITDNTSKIILNSLI